MKIRPFYLAWETRYSEPGGEPQRVLVRKMRIPDWYLQSVVYFFKTVEDAERMEYPSGSGFIVSDKHYHERSGRYVVTNSHILADENYVVRFNAFSEGRPVIKYFGPDDWYRHPNGDVAIAFFEYASGYGNYGCPPISIVDMIAEASLEREGVGIGDQAFMLGLFGDYYGHAQNQILPAARFGNITMLPAQKIRNLLTGLDEESILVEMYSMGGFSGSPVFVRRLPWTFGFERWRARIYPQGHDLADIFESLVEQANDYFDAISQSAEDRVSLLGINWGHLPLKHRIMHEETDSNSRDRPQKGIYAEGNHNIACVVPAWKIAELLEDETVVSRRKKVEEEIAMEEKRAKETGAIPDSLPFPDKDISPGLQRTLKRKFESGEIDEGVDKEEFLRLLGKSAEDDLPS